MEDDGEEGRRGNRGKHGGMRGERGGCKAQIDREWSLHDVPVIARVMDKVAHTPAHTDTQTYTQTHTDTETYTRHCIGQLCKTTFEAVLHKTRVMIRDRPDMVWFR